jgi:hypothetical protein
MSSIYLCALHSGEAASWLARTADIFDDNIFSLIKMPLESLEISALPVNVDEGDKINLTAADVDSFDVARYDNRKKWKESEIHTL